MQNTRFLDRREFTAEAVLAALSGVVILISESACGGGSGYSNPTSPGTPSPPTTGGPSSDEVGQISNNHLHVAVVTGAQLLAGTQVQLDIRGQADHTHFVTVTPDALASIKAGTLVAMDSTSTEGHNHTVTFNATAPDPGTGY
jgi:hypothetical protein